MNITTKIRGLGDRDSVITKAYTYEVKQHSIVVYQVQTTSPLSEGPVRPIHTWRFLMNNEVRGQACSEDFLSQEEAIKAAARQIENKKMTNENKLRSIIRGMLIEEMQLEAKGDFVATAGASNSIIRIKGLHPDTKDEIGKKIYDNLSSMLKKMKIAPKEINIKF